MDDESFSILGERMAGKEAEGRRESTWFTKRGGHNSSCFILPEERKLIGNKSCSLATPCQDQSVLDVFKGPGK